MICADRRDKHIRYENQNMIQKEVVSEVPPEGITPPLLPIPAVIVGGELG
jgi:hypothetical protein